MHATYVLIEEQTSQAFSRKEFLKFENKDLRLVVYGCHSS
jgi:hypothetical protein